MRSTGFVILSAALHCLCVMALALTPTRTISPDKAGENIEVTMGGPTAEPGIAAAPAPEPVKVKKVPKAKVAAAPEKIKPVTKQEDPAPVAKSEEPQTSPEEDK